MCARFEAHGIYWGPMHPLLRAVPLFLGHSMRQHDYSIQIQPLQSRLAIASALVECRFRKRRMALPKDRAPARVLARACSYRCQRRTKS